MLVRVGTSFTLSNRASNVGLISGPPIILLAMPLMKEEKEGLLEKAREFLSFRDEAKRSSVLVERMLTMKISNR